ncbi:MAG: hypothetical protein HGB05_22135 [Chloroflexi bacterium]|nr:hypothetical protein [Chloroflexota bacterium]
MQDQRRFMMVSPAAGFTNRVMTRLAERERASVRRRAMIGSASLVGAAIVMVALAAWQLASAAWVLITNPQVVVVLWNAFEMLAFWLGALVSASWVAVNVVVANLDPLQTLKTIPHRRRFGVWQLLIRDFSITPRSGFPAADRYRQSLPPDRP